MSVSPTDSRPASSSEMISTTVERHSSLSGSSLVRSSVTRPSLQSRVHALTRRSRSADRALDRVHGERSFLPCVSRRTRHRGSSRRGRTDPLLPGLEKRAHAADDRRRRCQVLGSTPALPSSDDALRTRCVLGDVHPCGDLPVTSAAPICRFVLAPAVPLGTVCGHARPSRACCRLLGELRALLGRSG